MPRDAYLRQKMCFLLSKNSSNPLKDYTNLKFVFTASVYIAEIPFLLPKIYLLPCLADFGQPYFSFKNKKYFG